MDYSRQRFRPITTDESFDRRLNIHGNQQCDSSGLQPTRVSIDLKHFTRDYIFIKIYLNSEENLTLWNLATPYIREFSLWYTGTPVLELLHLQSIRIVKTIEVYILGSEYLHYLENTTYTHIKTIVFKMRIDCRCSSFRARVPVHSKFGCNCNLS